MASRNKYPGLERRTVALARHHAALLAAADHRLEQEDMEQEILLHLHAQAEQFDPRRGSRATYEDRVVRNRTASLGRDARTVKRGHAAATVSFDHLLTDRSGGEPAGELGEAVARLGLISGSETAWEDVAALRCDLVRFLATQPRRLQECCILLQERSVAEAARVLGRHRSSIYAWLVVLRAGARSAGLDIYLQANPTDSVSAG